ncbi:MAG: hypothetical protein Q7S95_03605 [bacterium]|nr:hypothetical protein [bacterium]
MDTIKILIAFLVVLAVGLGAVIYYNKGAGLGGFGTISNTDTVSSQTKSSDQEENLSDDLKKLFAVPAESATSEEKKAHYILADRMSVTTGPIEIQGCTANPVVLKVKQGARFVVKNTGDKEYSFGFDTKVTIAPGKEATVVAEFKNGMGIYGYGCDNQTIKHPIGFVMVVPD